MHEGGVVMDVAVGPGKEFEERRDMWEGISYQTKCQV